MDLLDQLSKKMKTSGASAYELATIFKRIGLVGTNEFITLIRNFDDV